MRDENSGENFIESMTSKYGWAKERERKRENYSAARHTDNEKNYSNFHISADDIDFLSSLSSSKINIAIVFEQMKTIQL